MTLYFFQAVYLASEGLRPAGAVKAVAVGQAHEGSALRAGAPWPLALCGVVPRVDGLKALLEYHVEAFVQGVVEHVGGGEGRIPVQYFSP